MTGTLAPATGKISPSLDAVAYLDPIDRPGVEPAVGSPVDLFTLPADAVRIENGSVTVVADPATIPSTHVDENGLVTLRLDLTDPDTSQAGHWVASARAVRVADGSDAGPRGPRGAGPAAGRARPGRGGHPPVRRH